MAVKSATATSARWSIKWRCAVSSAVIAEVIVAKVVVAAMLTDHKHGSVFGGRTKQKLISSRCFKCQQLLQFSVSAWTQQIQIISGKNWLSVVRRSRRGRGGWKNKPFFWFPNWWLLKCWWGVWANSVDKEFWWKTSGWQVCIGIGQKNCLMQLSAIRLSLFACSPTLVTSLLTSGRSSVRGERSELVERKPWLSVLVVVDCCRCELPRFWRHRALSSSLATEWVSERESVR